MFDVKRTTGAGDFYSAIWTPAGTPSSGDQLHISHAVTWTPNVSDMWLGSGMGHSLAFGTAGKLTLMPTGTFNLHICGATGSGNISQFEFVADSTSGTININFDASQNSVGFPITVGNSFDANNRGGWNLIGNSTYPINVTSLPTNGTKNSYFFGSQAGSCNVNTNYVNLYRIGASTTRSFIPQMTSTRQPSIRVYNTLFSGCGEYQLNGDANYTGIVNFSNVRWINPVTDNSTYYALNINFGTNGSIPRIFSGCVIPSLIKTVNPYNIYLENCVLESGVLTTSTTAMWSGINNSLIHNFGIYATSPTSLNGNLTNCFLYWDNRDTANHHFVDNSPGMAASSYVNWSGNVFYSNTFATDSNCMLHGTIPLNINCVKNIILPNPSGGTSGALFTSNGEIIGSGRLVIEYNTVNVAGQHAIEFGHLLGPNISNVTNNGGLIQITLATSRTWQTGDSITIADVGGVTAANGTWTITRINGTTYTLDGSTFSGTYTSGGNGWKRETPNRYYSISNNIMWGSGQGLLGFSADSTSQIDIIPVSSINKNCRFAVSLTTNNANFTNQGNSWAGKFTSTPGTTDISADPQFVNSGVSLGAWAVTRGSVGATWYDREQDGLNYIKADPTLIPSLMSYIRDGYRIRNTALFTASTNSDAIGAGATYTQTGRPIVMKTGSSLTSNLFTGGKL